MIEDYNKYKQLLLDLFLDLEAFNLSENKDLNIEELNSRIIKLFENNSLSKDEQIRLLSDLKDIKPRFQYLSHSLVYKAELNTAKKFIQDKPDLNSIFDEFYKDLIIDQIRVTRQAVPGFDNYKSIFVGMGPMPISALLLNKYLPNLALDILDSSIEATSIAKEVLNASKVRNICVLEAKCVEEIDLKGYKIVWIASLVGSSRAQKIANNITKDQVIITRSCNPESLSRFIDVPFPYEELQDIYEMVLPVSYYKNKLGYYVLKKK